MNQELKTKWLEALKSGKYTQGQGALNRDGKMCCLGVLCDIIDPTKWVLGRDNASDGCLERFGYIDEVYTGYIPVDVADAVGLGNYDVWLAAVNDGNDPDNYATVIEYIEANL